MRAIHLETDEHFFMPVSGKHVYSICGRTFQMNHKPDREALTTFAAAVTCKNCLKKMKAQD